MSTKENSLQTLRGFLFDEIIKIRNGEAVEKESIAMAKLSHQIIESYKVEISAVLAVNELKDKNLDYAKNIKVIEDKSNVL